MAQNKENFFENSPPSLRRRFRTPAPLARKNQRAGRIRADTVSRSAAAGPAEEVGPSSSVSFSTDKTQRVGIVMIPLACAYWGLLRSPTFWQTTFTSSVSFNSHPTVATSTAVVSGSADRITPAAARLPAVLPADDDPGGNLPASGPARGICGRIIGESKAFKRLASATRRRNRCAARPRCVGRASRS